MLLYRNFPLMLLYLPVQVNHLDIAISVESYVMLERLVISLSYLIHVFLKFLEWIDSRVFNPIYHPLGDVSYHLGFNFVRRLKAWFAAEQASSMLPVRYPDDFT